MGAAGGVQWGDGSRMGVVEAEAGPQPCALLALCVSRRERVGGGGGDWIGRLRREVLHAAAAAAAPLAGSENPGKY